MACKQSERCDHADICRYAKSDAYNILGGSCYRPKEPQTNEEWLRQCNTEQLAEHLLNVWMDGAFNVNAEFGLNEAQIEKHKGYIVEWLKQPHTAKE